jgi:hypothetical protein
MPLSYSRPYSLGKLTMINPLKTSILLLASLVLFSHQPQLKTALKVSALPILQNTLVALRK